MQARLAVDFDASPDDVFDHLTSADLLASWWPSGADTDPVAGGGYHLWWDGPGWHLRGTYIEVDRPNRLVWMWAWTTRIFRRVA